MVKVIRDMVNAEALYAGVRGALGRAVEDPTSVFLGYLDASGNAQVKISNPGPDEVGMVYYTESYSEDLSEAVSVGRAYNTGLGAISDADLVFGTPIYIRRDTESGEWYVAGKRPRAGAGFDGAQGKRTEYPGVIVPATGLLDSLQPETMQAVVYGAPYTLDGVFKWIDTLYVDDQTGSIPVTDGQACYVLVEVDFASETLNLTPGAEFDASLTHQQAWVIDGGTGSLFPQAATDRFRAGYIKLVSGMTAITRSLIWAVQEIITKSTGGSGSSLIVTDGSTTVNPVTEIDFVGATVTDAGGGVADVTISSAGGSMASIFVSKDQYSYNNNTGESNNLLGTAQLGSKTLPANWWVEGRILHGEVWGTFSSDSTPPTVTLRVKLGGTNILVGGSTAALTASQNTKQWHCEFDILCTSVSGSTAAFTSRGLFVLYSGTSSVQTFFFADQGNTIDPTTTNLVEVKSQWNNASVNNAFGSQLSELWYSQAV